MGETFKQRCNRFRFFLSFLPGYVSSGGEKHKNEPRSQTDVKLYLKVFQINETVFHTHSQVTVYTYALYTFLQNYQFDIQPILIVYDLILS